MDYRGRAPIHVAAIKGDIEIVKFLIDLRVDLDQLDQQGLSPLFMACSHRNSVTAKMLNKAGANVIVDKKRLERMLCSAGYEGDLEFIQLLTHCEVDLNLKDYDNRTIGHLAACENKIDILEYLSTET